MLMSEDDLMWKCNGRVEDCTKADVWYVLHSTMDVVKTEVAFIVALLWFVVYPGLLNVSNGIFLSVVRCYR